MQLKLSALAAILSVVLCVEAQWTAEHIIKDMNEITVLSEGTQLIAASINSHTVTEKVPETVHRFHEIITLVNKEADDMQSGPRVLVDIKEQTKLCAAFRNFAVVNRHLFEILTYKQENVREAGLAARIASVLNIIDGGVEVLSSGVIRLAPACSRGAYNDKRELDAAMRRAVVVYSR